ncbi:hypothetical protein [Bradyrhizobium sp. USDA 3256]
MPLQPLLLRLEFKFDLESKDSQRAIGAVIKNIRAWARPAMHCRRSCAIVVVTSETSTEFLTRLRPVLEEMSAIENYWCHVAPDRVVAKHGGLDPLVTRVVEAWEEARKRRKSYYVR